MLVDALDILAELLRLALQVLMLPLTIGRVLVGE